MAPTVSVVIVAYGAEPWLERSVQAVLASEGVDADVVLVDNGCTDGAVERLAGHDGVTVVRPGTNTGFAGGCDAGAAKASGELLALVNPDLIVEPACLGRLAATALAAEGVIATASVRLADAPDRLNSAGNAVHWTGVSWSGSFDEPAADHDRPGEAFAASGACMALRRAQWEALGGFDERFFAYYEDADLSVRAWQAGGSVAYVPEAVCVHRYEFGRRPEKYFLLERNRLLMVLTCWQLRTILLALPVHLALEVGFLGLGAKEGWFGHKVRAYRWLWQHRREVRERRRQVQAARVRSDRELAHLFSAALDPANIAVPSWWPVLDRALQSYWSVVRRLL